MDEIVFNRPKKYTVVRELGSGACGKTVLLRDSDLGMEVVAKKYAPLPELERDPKLRKEFLARFRREAQLLLQATHENIVRIYTYYDYPEAASAFFVMEYVDGTDIMTYAAANRGEVDRLFVELVSGFHYLEKKGILHRDIRPANVLVTNSGRLRIIDFGFGKILAESEVAPENNAKSVTLNWNATKPDDFKSEIYDVSTEIYFVGKLVQDLVAIAELKSFTYADVVSKMIAHKREDRLTSFGDAVQLIAQAGLAAQEFSPADVLAYRAFAEALRQCISKVQYDANYVRDYDKIVQSLLELQRSIMLEELLPDNAKLVRIFLSGTFQYFRTNDFPVSTLTKFVELLRGLKSERRDIVFANLFARLDTAPRYSRDDMNDEIPF